MPAPQRKPALSLVECMYGKHARAVMELFGADPAPSVDELAEWVAWWKGKEAGRFPVLGVETATAELLGCASYGPFRATPGLDRTVEVVVRVRSTHRRKGIGRALFRRLLDAAERQGCHVMVAVLEPDDVASVRFYQQLGFAPAGAVREARWDGERWRDVEFHQLIVRALKAAPQHEASR